MYKIYYVDDSGTCTLVGEISMTPFTFDGTTISAPTATDLSCWDEIAEQTKAESEGWA